MRRDDFILRLIAQLVQGLYQVLGLAKLREYQAALKTIDQLSNQLIGVDTPAIGRMSDAEMIARLTFAEPETLARSKCVVFAALLDQAGGIYSAQHRYDESHDCFLKALRLMLYIEMADPEAELPEYSPRVDQLVAALGAYHLPPQTLLDLLRYHEQRGDYARAEDALFLLIDVTAAADTLRLGIAFYERLLAQSDAALEAGRLPRDEVKAGLHELRQRLRR